MIKKINIPKLAEKYEVKERAYLLFHSWYVSFFIYSNIWLYFIYFLKKILLL